MQANESQIGGKHYASAYQHWDFVHEALHGAYLEGQITKYVYRWKKKNGIQDLEKALHFLQKLRETQDITPMATLNGAIGLWVDPFVKRFISENQIMPTEAEIIHLIATWHNEEDLATAAHKLRGLIMRESLRPS